MHRKKQPSALGRVLKASGAPLSLVLLTLGSMTALGALSVVESYFFGIVIDSATLGVREVLGPVTTIVLITLGEYVTFIVNGFLTDAAVETALCNLRKKATATISHLDYKSLSRMTTGDLMSRTMGDLNGLSDFWKTVALQFYYDILVLGIGFVLCLRVSPHLTALGFLLIPPVFFLNLRVSRPIKSASEKARAASGAANGLLRNIVTGAAAVKAYTLYTKMQEKFTAALDHYVKAQTGMGKIQALMEPMGSLMYFLPTLAIMTGGGFLIAGGRLTAGMYITFVFTFGWVSHIILNVKDHITGLREGEATAARVCELLDLPVETPFPIRAGSPRADPIISIRNLSFSYGAGEVLKNITLDIHRGEVVAIVGQSGSGKSTLIKMLYGLYAIESGSVTVAGLPLTEAHFSSVRDKISVVSQDNFLFPDTIRNNLLMGGVDASDADIAAACESAGIHAFIAALPKGYESVIGEKGCNLSGGQRQRLCIARAFLHNREILVLDEPTSALDALTESNLQSAIAMLMRGKTVITISHRLSTIQSADRILVMHDGQIAESGTHGALLAMGGIYSGLYANR